MKLNIVTVFESNDVVTTPNEASRLLDGSEITSKYNEVENDIELDGVDTSTREFPILQTLSTSGPDCQPQTG